jgi:hypothetical protein
MQEDTGKVLYYDWKQKGKPIKGIQRKHFVFLVKIAFVIFSLRKKSSRQKFNEFNKELFSL